LFGLVGIAGNPISDQRGVHPLVGGGGGDGQAGPINCKLFGSHASLTLREGVNRYLERIVFTYEPRTFLDLTWIGFIIFHNTSSMWISISNFFFWGRKLVDCLTYTIILRFTHKLNFLDQNQNQMHRKRIITKTMH
jgi:hypothetical protein